MTREELIESILEDKATAAKALQLARKIRRAEGGAHRMSVSKDKLARALEIARTSPKIAKKGSGRGKLLDFVRGQKDAPNLRSRY